MIELEQKRMAEIGGDDVEPIKPTIPKAPSQVKISTVMRREKSDVCQSTIKKLTKNV